MQVQRKATDLTAEERAVVERLLGRALKESEVVQVNAEEPISQAWRAVLEDMRELQARVADVPEDEIYTLIDEAVEHVRRHPE